MAVLALAFALASQPYTIQDETAEGVWYVVLRDESNGVEASIAPAKGGEMASFRVRFQNRWIETLYRARDYSGKPGWTGKAPFLWPATGRNFPRDVKANEEAKGSSYDWNGKRYPMPIHGFVRDMEWKQVSRNADARSARLRLSLDDSADSRQFYPYGFHLMVDYVLSDGRISVEYTIGADASNAQPMPFSAGNHITFVTPLVPGSDPLAMRFETPSSVEFLKGAGGVPTGERRAKFWAQPIRLAEFPANLAISLGGYSIPEPFMKLSDPAGLTLVMRQRADSVPPDPVIRFNVWGDPKAGYFSPEPWVGLQNSFNLRQGLVSLAPGKSWRWRFDLSALTPSSGR